MNMPHTDSYPQGMALQILGIPVIHKVRPQTIHCLQMHLF